MKKLSLVGNLISDTVVRVIAGRCRFVELDQACLTRLR